MPSRDRSFPEPPAFEVIGAVFDFNTSELVLTLSNPIDGGLTDIFRQDFPLETNEGFAAATDESADFPTGSITLGFELDEATITPITANYESTHGTVVTDIYGQLLAAFGDFPLTVIHTTFSAVDVDGFDGMRTMTVDLDGTIFASALDEADFNPTVNGASVGLFSVNATPGSTAIGITFLASLHVGDEIRVIYTPVGSSLTNTNGRELQPFDLSNTVIP